MWSEVAHSWTYLCHLLVFLLCHHHPCLSCLSFLFLFLSSGSTHTHRGSTDHHRRRRNFALDTGQKTVPTIQSCTHLVIDSTHSRSKSFTKFQIANVARPEEAPKHDVIWWGNIHTAAPDVIPMRILKVTNRAT